MEKKVPYRRHKVVYEDLYDHIVEQGLALDNLLYALLTILKSVHVKLRIIDPTFYFFMSHKSTKHTHHTNHQNLKKPAI
jgi:hypothetical protein